MSRIVGAIGLIVLSPLLVLIAFAVALSMGWPVLFTQVRSGRGGEPFTIYKFRTMRNAAYSNEPDAERITRIGHLLRSASLDELPSLWNLIRGEMVLVGPRPLIHRYAALYTSYEAQRLRVKPGITGWQQINGRNSLTWKEKFELDVWYVQYRSLWLDLRILLRTPVALFKLETISHPDHATMPTLEEELGSDQPLQRDDP